MLQQRRVVPSRFLPGLVAGLAIGLVIAFVAFGIGASQSDAEVMTGRAHIGHNMASIESGGWFYGVNESIAWIDADGSSHEDGWPTCLQPEGTTQTVRFAAVPPVTTPVTTPDGSGFGPVVVWVDCRA
jgi:hypothetical protein